MAVSPVLVNAGNLGGMGDQNNAFNSMENAMVRMEDRKNKRLDRGKAARDRLSEITDENLTGDIIQRTKKNTVLEDFNTRFDTEYNTIFDENGQAHKGMEGQAASWGKGGFGDSVSKYEMQNLERLAGGVNDAKKYSDNIYDQMIASGLSPAQAEAARKTQLERHKKAPMSKAALQRQKILADAETSKYEKTMDLAKAMGKQSNSSGGNIVGHDSNGDPIYGPKRTSSSSSKYKGKGGGYTGDDFVSDFGGRIKRDEKPGYIMEPIDKWNYSDADDVNDAVGIFSAAGSTKDQIHRALTMPGSVNDAHGEAPRIDKEQFTVNMKALLAEDKASGYGSGSGSSKGGFAQGAFSGYTPAAQQRIAKTEKAARGAMEANLAKILNQGNLPGKDATLNSIFDWYDGKEKPSGSTKSTSSKKTGKGGKTIGDKNGDGKVTEKEIEEVVKAVESNPEAGTNGQAVRDFFSNIGDFASERASNVGDYFNAGVDALPDFSGEFDPKGILDPLKSSGSDTTPLLPEGERQFPNTGKNDLATLLKGEKTGPKTKEQTKRANAIKVKRAIDKSENGGLLDQFQTGDVRTSPEDTASVNANMNGPLDAGIRSPAVNSLNGPLGAGVNQPAQNVLEVNPRNAGAGFRSNAQGNIGGTLANNEVENQRRYQNDNNRLKQEEVKSLTPAVELMLRSGYNRKQIEQWVQENADTLSPAEIKAAIESIEDNRLQY